MRAMLSALSKLVIVAAVVIAFSFGLAGTVYLSLRGPEVNVPEVVGKSRFDGEATLGEANLNLRVRASRFKAGTDPGMIVDQSPRAGEIVKAGQTIAVVLSREPKEGENTSPDITAEEKKTGDSSANKNTAGAASSKNENKNDNQNRNKRNKNSNRNANQNADNVNRNVNERNANRNGNANVNNRNITGVIINRNAIPGRTNSNSNTNRRLPVTSTPPFNPSGSRP